MWYGLLLTGFLPGWDRVVSGCPLGIRWAPAPDEGGLCSSIWSHGLSTGRGGGGERSYSNSRLYLGHGFSQFLHIPMHLGRPGHTLLLSPHSTWWCRNLWGCPHSFGPALRHGSSCAHTRQSVPCWKGLLRIYSLLRTWLSNFFLKNRHGLAQCWTTYFWIVT